MNSINQENDKRLVWVGPGTAAAGVGGCGAGGGSGMARAVGGCS